MFYISPYHASSQPVFRELDLCLGKPLGTALYLLATLAGAGLIHAGFAALPWKRRTA